MDPLIGQLVLGRYEVERRIGSGGMGSVYVGKQKAIGRSVALKILRMDLMTNEHVRERFRREAEIIGKLRHPNTIQLIDYGETEDGLAVMVMELLVGRPLNDALKESGPLGLAAALTVGIECASSLAEAHLLGLVHRDLKPANIFLVEVAGQTHAKVLDFGIARILDEEATRLTSTGQVFGTPRYMSPEQALSTGEVDSRSDIYSLGLIIYECIVGQPPFVAQTSIQYLSAHSTQPPPKLREHYQDAPQALEDLIDSCLAKEPADRPQTAEEVVQALGVVRRGVESGAGADMVFVRTPNARPAVSAPGAAAGSGSGSTKTQISQTRTEVRLKGATKTSFDGSTPGAPARGVGTAGVTTAIDDKTMIRPPSARSDTAPRGSPPPSSKLSPLVLGGVGLAAVAIVATVVYWRMSQDIQVAPIALDASTVVRAQEFPDAAAIAAVVPAHPDAEVVEPADSGTETETTTAQTETHEVKKKGKGKEKGRKQIGPSSIVGTQGGVVTGPASLVIETGDDTAEMLKVAKACKDSGLKGEARMTLKGCPSGCAIVFDEAKCGGKTPATKLAVPTGFHNVAVVCGGKVVLSTQQRFPNDEDTELRCR